MPLINTSVPNLIQGVSQQPDATRFAGQCEAQENALSSVVDGLKKRPNTRHVARLLGSAIAEDSFVHFINRSESEKYVLIHDGSTVRAWNLLTGAQATINGSSSYTPSSGSYLDCKPEHLKGLTVADNTFVTNTSESVALDTNKTAALPKEALVFIKQGDYKKKYQVNVTIHRTDTASYAPATATATIEEYLYKKTTRSRCKGSGCTTYYYRWRVTGLTVTNGGSGFANAPTVTISSSSSTYENAVYTANIGGLNNSVVSFNKINEGDYAPGGGSTAWYGSTSRTPPTISVTITPNATGGGAGSINLSSYIWSGTSESGNSQNANTDYIALWLTSNNATSGYNSTNDRPFDVDDPNNVSFDDYFNINRQGNVIKLTKKSTWDGDFTITTEDSLANSGMDSIYKETSAITNLPTRCFDGFKVKVIGDAELNQDDYYVVFQTADGSSFGTGSWVETVGFDVEKGFKASTMPHVFKNVDEDEFVFDSMPFEKRKVGDKVSNPNPSFIGRSITSMFFFKNRLGFLCDDNVILSEAGLGAENENGIFKYNLFRTTVTTLLDSDPIDVTVSSTRVSLLKEAVGLQENLLLFSDNGQFVLKGGDLLTAKTISITPATNFDYNSSVKPVALGSYVYYPFTRGNFTGLRELSVNPSTDAYDSAEITEHVPAYIPSDVSAFAGTNSEDMLAVVSASEPSSIYIYNFFWNNNQKVLSSWSKFTMGAQIRGIEFIESSMYIIAVPNQDPTIDLEATDAQGDPINAASLPETHLLVLPLEAGLKDVNHNGDTADYLTLLDERSRVKVQYEETLIRFIQPDGTYSAANADQPFDPDKRNMDDYKFVSASGAVYDLTTSNVGAGLQVFVDTSNVTAGSPESVGLVDGQNGKVFSNTTYGYIGKLYTMKYEFSTQIFKASSGKSGSPTAATDMMVRSGALFFDDTHTFDVKVTPSGRSETTTTFSADDRPEAETLGNRKFAEGDFKFPVHSKAKHAKIVVENDSPFDSKFSSAEFESFVHPRSSRYG